MKPQEAGNRSSSVDQPPPKPVRRHGCPRSRTTARCWSSPPAPGSREPRTMKMPMRMDGLQRPRSIRRDRRKLVQPVEWRSGSHDPGRCRGQMETGPSRSESRGDRLYLLFDWDNGARRGLIDAHREGTTAGREVYQSDRSKDYAPLDRLDREQSKDRRALDRRTSGFSPIRRSTPQNERSPELPSGALPTSDAAAMAPSAIRQARSGWVARDFAPAIFPRARGRCVRCRRRTGGRTRNTDARSRRA